MTDSADSGADETATPSTDTAIPAPALRFPGIWHAMPLDGSDAARQSRRAVASALAGTGDERAQARAILDQRLARAAESAGDLGGRRLFLAEQVTDGVPVTAALTEILVDAKMSPAIGTAASEVMDVLLEGFRHTDDPEAADGERFTIGDAEVFRRVSVQVDDGGVRNVSELGDVEPVVIEFFRSLGLPEDGAVPSTSTLRVEYWVTVPTTKRVLLFSFATPFAELREPLVNLFTAIVSTLEWIPADGTAPTAD
ncbi:hypothetical protein ACL9RL_03065 [Plantibacter sp. Mn2098]|uniref:hypothetical protein n=1 Tax=Plantibacter sp. Mn2098 TaxID=3395266 RepID=UPI003BC8E026